MERANEKHQAQGRPKHLPVQAGDFFDKPRAEADKTPEQAEDLGADRENSLSDEEAMEANFDPDAHGD